MVSATLTNPVEIPSATGGRDTHPFLIPPTARAEVRPPRAVILSHIPLLAAAMEAWAELEGRLDRGYYWIDKRTGFPPDYRARELYEDIEKVTSYGFPTCPEALTFEDKVIHMVIKSGYRATRADVEEALEAYLLKLLGGVPMSEAWRYAEPEEVPEPAQPDYYRGAA